MSLQEVETRGGRYLFLEPRDILIDLEIYLGGSYYLRVSENVDNTGLTPCEEVYYFTVREYLPIQYNGDTTLLLTCVLVRLMEELQPLHLVEIHLL